VVEAEPDETLVDEGTVDEAGMPGTVTDEPAAVEAEDQDETPADDEYSGDDEAPDDEAPADEDGQKEPAAATPERERLLLPVCLGVATVALAGLAVWFGVNASKSAGSASGFGAGTSNIALTNPAATAQVTQQVSNAVDTIFSYNYTNTAKTDQAARTLLTGKASTEYANLFKVVQQEAPAEKLVLTTTVTNSGVEFLNASTARLLIFVNQQDTGATKASTTDAGAMFSVTAVFQGGHWKIENINTFGSGG
jgi:Mce-associated membrane protein